MNYLESPVISAYIAAREHAAFYASLKHVGPRMDFYPKLTWALQSFLDVVDVPEARALIDATILNDERSPLRAPASGSRVDDLASRARCLDPQGFDLLSLDSPLTFESLKRAYRAAAFRNHPDRGGDVDTMRDINCAFARFHAWMSSAVQQAPSTGSNDLDSAMDASDFICAMALLLVRVHNNEYAYDRSLRIARQLIGMGFPSESHPSPTSRQFGTLIRESWLMTAHTCALGLAQCRRREDSLEMYAIAQRFGHPSLPHRLAPWQRLPTIESLERAMVGPRPTHLSLPSIASAKNALRLGLIDQKRHAAALGRFQRKHQEDALQHNALSHYLDCGGFLQDLSADRTSYRLSASGIVASKYLVGEPSYGQWRIDDLSVEQQRDYFRAFGSDSTLELVRKYYFIRLTSTLRSMIAESPPPHCAITAECRLMSELMDVRGGGRASWDNLREFSEYLSGLPLDEQNERRTLLREIDKKYSKVAGGMVFGGREVSPELQLARTSEFTAPARLPLAALRQTLRTGLIGNGGSRRKEAATLLKDSNRLDSLNASEVHDRAWRALDSSTGISERVCAIESYCVALIELGERSVHVEHLQLGFWVDKLTAALAATSNWMSVTVWIERFFALPERYRGRSSHTEQKALRARLVRARARMADAVVVSTGVPAMEKEPLVLKTLARARQFKAEIDKGTDTQSSLARQHGLTKARVSQIMHLMKLSSDTLAVLDRIAVRSPALVPSELYLRKLSRRSAREQLAAVLALDSQASGHSTRDHE